MSGIYEQVISVMIMLFVLAVNYDFIFFPELEKLSVIVENGIRIFLRCLDIYLLEVGIQMEPGLFSSSKACIFARCPLNGSPCIVS